MKILLGTESECMTFDSMFITGRFQDETIKDKKKNIKYYSHVYVKDHQVKNRNKLLTYSPFSTW